MGSYETVHRSGTSDATAVAWLISFGDLLTLLVCFFLVLTPWQSLHTRQDDQRTQDIRAHPAVADGHGTSLAYAPLGRSAGIVAEVPIVASDVGTLAANLRGVLAEQRGAAGSVVLQLCEHERRPQVVEALAVALRDGAPTWKVAAVEMQVMCSDLEVLRPITGHVIGSVRLLRE